MSYLDTVQNSSVPCFSSVWFIISPAYIISKITCCYKFVTLRIETGHSGIETTVKFRNILRCVRLVRSPVWSYTYRIQSACKVQTGQVGDILPLQVIAREGSSDVISVCYLGDGIEGTICP